MPSTDFSKLSTQLFHAYDIRIDASLLDHDSLVRLYDALARYSREILKTDSVLLCRDARLSGAASLQTAIERFSSYGFTVYTELHPITTCQFYASCIQLDTVMGIMIGASHNPGTYTGQKIVGPGCVPIARDIGPDGGLTRVQQLFIKGLAPEKAQKPGTIHLYDGQKPYIDSCLNLAAMDRDSLSSLTVVVDFLNGSAGLEILTALEKTGATVIPRNMVPNGFFPLGPPNPILASSVEPTMEYLQNNPDYDFCFCFDGDGDRMDVIARGGRAVEPSVVMAFLAPVLKNLYPDTFAKHIGFDSKTNPLLLHSIEEYALVPQLIPNGHSKIKHLLATNVEDGLVAAVEDSAHYYLTLPSGSKMTPTESTLLICLLFLGAWLEDKQRFEALLTLQNQVHRKREWGYIYATEHSRHAALQAVENEFTRKGYSLCNTLPNGSALGSTLLEFASDKDTQHWASISQRSSQSEAGIARWSVIAGNMTLLDEIVATIEKIASAQAVSVY